MIQEYIAESVADFIRIVNELQAATSDIAHVQREYLKEKVNRSEDYDSFRYYAAVTKTKEEILERESYYSESKPSGYQFFYRGHYKREYKLLPSVFRGSFWEKEDQFFHEITLQCPEVFGNASYLERLVTMQHYDCPTRLLDVTTNPLVALYFTCENFGCAQCNHSQNGEVIVFPVLPEDITYSDSGRARLLSCLAGFSVSEKEKLFLETTASIEKGKYDQKNNGYYKNQVVERFYMKIATENPAFKRELDPLDVLRPVFVRPNKTNRRILKQDGAFILNGLSKNAGEAESKIEDMGNFRIRIVNQERVLRELASIGIHEASLFPEVDKVAHYLKQTL
jgi:hypothetical protein